MCAKFAAVKILCQVYARDKKALDYELKFNKPVRLKSTCRFFEHCLLRDGASGLLIICSRKTTFDTLSWQWHLQCWINGFLEWS